MDDRMRVQMKNEDQISINDQHLNEMTYTLTIKLLEGRDLVIRDSSGTSDPYVKFRYDGKTLFKSKILYKNLNPTWNELFTTNSITDLSKPVEIVVKDFDRFAVNDFMGDALLNLNTIAPGKTHNLKLFLRGVTQDQYLGYLLMDVSISIPSQKSLEDIAEHATLQQTVERVQSSPQLFSNILKKSPSGSAIFKPTRKKNQINKTLSAVVHIVVIRAKRLLHTDSHTNAPLPSPYAQIKFGNQLHSTKPAERTLNPKWYEQFELYLYKDDNQEPSVEITVMDKRKNVCMGKGWLNLDKFQKEITHRKWLDLGDGAGSLFCLLTINIPSIVDSVQELTEENVAQDEKLFQNRYSLSNSLKNHKDVGHLIIKVYKAQGLASADINGKSDPFCVVELANSRLHTHTVFNSLNPQWNKLFTFQVKDIHAAVEITVLDEDSSGHDFLGKLAVPLMSIKNNEKRWYALKDKKLLRRAKGQILLEFELFYNPVKAICRTFQPKEQKYTGHENKFKRSVFMKNLLRLKVFNPNIDLPRYMDYCLSWENPVFSSVTFMFLLLATYYFELYMVPLGLLVLLLKNYIEKLIVSGVNPVMSIEYLEPNEEEEDILSDAMNDNVSLKDRFNEIQDGLVLMQDTLAFSVSSLERIKNCFNFTQPLLSWLAVVMLAAASVVFYFVPFRILVMLYIIKRFTKKLRAPNSIPNNEVIDFLSRVPSDEELRLFGEFKPENVTPLADQTKKGFGFPKGLSFK